MLPDDLFYDTRPDDIHVYQEVAIKYLLTERPAEMHSQGIHGRTEAAWAPCTKDSVFLPLIDPTRQMNKLYPSLQSQRLIT
jgi:hypothetical protein